MIQNHRLSHLLVVAPELSPSLALVATYPLGELDKQGALKLRIRTAREASAQDLNWCDLVFAVRPATAAMAVLISTAKRMGRKVMCHWDDDLLSIPPESNSYAYFARPGVRKLTISNLMLADVVLTSSHNLATHLRSVLDTHDHQQTPILVLPVPALNLNAMVYLAPVTAQSQTRPLRVGYAGSVDQTELLQALVVPALENLWSAGNQIHLQLIGPRLAIPKPWRKFVTEMPVTNTYEDWLALRNTLTWDLCLAPLASGHFYSCKYHNKYLEFSAAGMPCLLSNVPPFCNVVRHGVNGFLTENTIDAWTHSIIALHDQGSRERVAKSAFDDISSNYQLTRIAAEIRVALTPWLLFRAPQKEPILDLTRSKRWQWIQSNILRRYF